MLENVSLVPEAQSALSSKMSMTAVWDLSHLLTLYWLVQVCFKL